MFGVYLRWEKSLNWNSRENSSIILGFGNPDYLFFAVAIGHALKNCKQQWNKRMSYKLVQGSIDKVIRSLHALDSLIIIAGIAQDKINLKRGWKQPESPSGCIIHTAK